MSERHHAQQLNIDRIRAATAGLVIGRDLRYLPAVDSTNALARDLPPGTWENGTTIVTDYQRWGRGRQGRGWIVPPNTSLLMSVLLERVAPSPPSDIIMMAALAVWDAVAELDSLQPRLKWPNDVLLAGRKVCGILAESSRQSRGAVVLGIGLNVNFDPAAFPEIPPTATSLQRELGHRVDREALAVLLVQRLDMWYRCVIDTPEAVFTSWVERLDTIGSRLVVAEPTGTWLGTATAVRRDGGLLVRDENGTIRTVYAADVSIQQSGDFTTL